MSKNTIYNAINFAAILVGVAFSHFYISIGNIKKINIQMQKDSKPKTCHYISLIYA